MQIIANYWGIIIGIIIGIGYIITHRQISFAYVRKQAIRLMFIVEAHAEKFLIDNGQAKLGWVVDTIYAGVPIYFKPILNKVVITYIVQKLFDKALAYAKAHQVKVIPQPPDSQEAAAV